MATLMPADVKKIIANAPAGTSPEGIVAALREQGHQIVGYVPYSGTLDEPGNMSPGLLDPVEWVGMAGGGLATRLGANVSGPALDVAFAGARGLGKGMAPVGKMIGPVLGGGLRMAGRRVFGTQNFDDFLAGFARKEAAGASTAAPAAAPLEDIAAAQEAEKMARRSAIREATGRVPLSERPAAPVVAPAAAPATPALAEAAPAIPKGKLLIREHLRSVPKPQEKPSLSLIEKPAPKLDAGAKASTARIAAGKAVKSRHNVQYYSESQGKFIDIEKMHIGHLKSAMNKLGAKLARSKKPAPVSEAVFEAMKKEVTHRATKAGGLTVYDAPGAAASAKRIAAAKVPARALPGPGTAAAPGPSFEVPGQLHQQLARTLQIQAKMNEMGISPDLQSQMWEQLRASGGF